MEKELLNDLTKCYPQFKKTSLLYDMIIQALGCSLLRAKQLARTHCNLVSFWIILFTSENYKGGYSKFYKWMLEENYCNDKGYILVNKQKILDSLKINSILRTYREYEDILDPLARLNPDKYYQVKINADTRGWHFMACYIEDGVFYGSDTSYRGNPFLLTDKVTPENFVKLDEVC